MSQDNRSFVEEKNFEQDQGSIENEEKTGHQANDEMVVLDMEEMEEEQQNNRNRESFVTGPKSQVAYDFESNGMKLNFEGGVFNIEQEKK